MPVVGGKELDSGRDWSDFLTERAGIAGSRKSSDSGSHVGE